MSTTDLGERIIGPFPIFCGSILVLPTGLGPDSFPGETTLLDIRVHRVECLRTAALGDGLACRSDSVRHALSGRTELEDQAGEIS